jgi:hypothetical protein
MHVNRFNLEPSVIRIPIVPGSDPRTAYGDLAERGVKGVVLEAFGVGNMPDLPQQGWMPWLRQQTKKGLQVCGFGVLVSFFFCQLHSCCVGSHQKCSQQSGGWFSLRDNVWQSRV